MFNLFCMVIKRITITGIKLSNRRVTVIETVMNVAISNMIVQTEVVDLVTMFPAICKVAIYHVNPIYRPHGGYNALTECGQGQQQLLNCLLR